jgi:hypothetical protein
MERNRGSVVLPVSGAAIVLTAPTGQADLLLAEGRPEDPVLALAFVESSARGAELLDFAALPATDMDTLIVRLRQASLGDRVVADVSCSQPGCRCRVDISFGLDDYLAHHRPKTAPARGRHWAAEVSVDRPGFFVAQGQGKDTTQVEFRLPTLADLITVTPLDNPADELAALCLLAQAPTPRQRALAERAMAALAPPLSGPIAGQCPQCGAAISALFDARVYCLRELRERARFVYDDIDVLAERYHWSEQEILNLPNERRGVYAERARQARAS